MAETRELGLLTGKPVLWVANISEAEIGSGEAVAADLAERVARAIDGALDPEVVPLAVRLESELAQLDPGERAEFAAELGLERSGLERLVERAFDTLGLVRYYTIARSKLTAWAIPRGTPAPAAAGVIHTDMERGFIRAQVAGYDELAAAGSWQALAQSGRVRTEGRDYEIADGDVVEFLFRS